MWELVLALFVLSPILGLRSPPVLAPAQPLHLLTEPVAVNNEWIPLMNYHADDGNKDKTAIEAIEGYLRMSITVLGPGDKQHTHDEAEEETKKSSESGKPLLSPEIKKVNS